MSLRANVSVSVAACLTFVNEIELTISVLQPSDAVITEYCSPSDLI